MYKYTKQQKKQRNKQAHSQGLTEVNKHYNNQLFSLRTLTNQNIHFDSTQNKQT
jgi:hypothetical protein